MRHSNLSALSIAAVRPGNRSRRAALIWLALAAILFRGLIPDGDMLMTGSAGHPGLSIAFCPHMVAMPMFGDHHQRHSGSGKAAPDQLCPFAVAAAHGLVSASFSHLAVTAYAPPSPTAEAVSYQAAPLWLPPVRGPPAVLFMSV